MGNTLHSSISPTEFPQVSETVLLPGREAKTAPLPEKLHPRLSEHLRTLGISRLWTHQRLCWEAAGNGSGVSCFTKARRQAEPIYQAATAELEDRSSPAEDRLSPYRAGYTPEQRR